ncbi:MAG: XdhC family protein [Chloroflexi bacterium]|nr:XdhC family protein [Chloroflexota bacterium]
MQTVFPELVKALEKGEACVLATVVRVKGSTPQKPGARLLVRQDGSGVGTLGGGCVEGDIWAAARTALKEVRPPWATPYQLNEELAAQDGLVCGGTMYFLIEPLRPGNPFPGLARQVVSATAGGPPVALGSLVKAPQGSSLPLGTLLLIRADGGTEGSLGDLTLDQTAAGRAQRLFGHGGCECIVTTEGAELYVEAFITPPTVVLCGGGHISRALAPLAKRVGFRVQVIDDRPEFANREQFPEADEVLVSPYDLGLQQLHINANTFIVIATRGHRFDDLATETAARSAARYVGLVGSKRKTILIFRQLLERGIPMERLQQVRAPVGLDIGARTPEEIALSIMAEIVMVRLGGGGSPMKLSDALFRKLLPNREPSLARG